MKKGFLSRIQLDVAKGLLNNISDNSQLLSPVTNDIHQSNWLLLLVGYSLPSPIAHYRCFDSWLIGELLLFPTKHDSCIFMPRWWF